MFDNYSNGKRVLVNYIISGIGNMVVELTSMTISTDGSTIIGSGKANVFLIGVMEFTIALIDDTAQLVSVEYKVDEKFTVTINYDAGVIFSAYHWDSLDGWMPQQYSNGPGSTTSKYNYIIVKTECNLSSSNSNNGYFKINGKCYFDAIAHDAPVRLHPGDTIEPIEHCSPTIILSAIPAGT